MSDKVINFLKKNKFNNVKRFVAIITCRGYLGSADMFLENYVKK